MSQSMSASSFLYNRPTDRCLSFCRLQTGQYSTQIFSLAVLLSSLFVYNQMGGIDEAALDRLSLVTEVTARLLEPVTS